METLRPNTTNIAIIDNDTKQARNLSISLGNMGYHVSHFSSAVSALQDKNLDNIKLFLVDMELPQMDGLSFYKALKAHYDEELPFVIAISQQQHLEPIALRSGVDDFIAKPFNINGLIERVNRLVGKRYKKTKKIHFKLGNLFLDYEKWQCTWYGQYVALTTKEYLILQHLVNRPTVIFERNTILDICYGDECVEQRSVDSMIKRIRKKFREVHPRNEKFDRIKTKYGVGYYWQSLNLYQQAS